MVYGCIYLITNHKDGKMYVGQHNKTNIDERWRAHKRNASNPEYKYPLYTAIRKHGIENFTIDILYVVLYSALDKYEIYFADLLNTYVWNKRGYNALYCGGGGGGREITEETRQRLRDSHKHQKPTPESCLKNSQGLIEWHKNNPESSALRIVKAVKTRKERGNYDMTKCHTPEAELKRSNSIMSSEYHNRVGISNQKYISVHIHGGWRLYMDNKKYGRICKKFETLEEAIKARDEFIVSKTLV